MRPLSLVGIGPGRPQASCQFPSAETLILNQATCSKKWRQGEVPGLLSLRAGGLRPHLCLVPNDTWPQYTALADAKRLCRIQGLTPPAA